MTTRTASRRHTGWLVVTSVSLVELGSAAMSVWEIGPVHAPLRMPAVTAWAFYVLPLLLHLAAVLTAWSGARETDAHELRLARYRLKGVTALLMAMGAIAILNRAGVHPMAAPYVAMTCGLGPLLLLLVFVPNRQEGAHAEADR